MNIRNEAIEGFSVIPTDLNTKRLHLRPPRLDDAEAIFIGYAQDPEVTRYLVWEPYKSIVGLEHFLSDCIDAWRVGERLPWVIRKRADDELVGMIELRLNDTQADLGYVIARRFWGQGYATEALRAVVQAALALPRIYRVAAACDVENPASARVMEKAGMTREGLLRRYNVHPTIGPEPRDAFIYAIVK